MRVEKAAGPEDRGLVGHGGALGIFPKNNKKYWRSLLIHRIHIHRSWTIAGTVEVC